MTSLKQTCNSLLRYFRRKDDKKLRKLKNEILEEASLKSSKLYFELAVVAYVLSKITSKPRLVSDEYGKELKDIEKSLQELVRAVGRANDEELLKILKKTDQRIRSLEKADRRYVRDLVSKGRIKLAATMYAQGISLGAASELSGIEKQDIQDYAGNTMMFDRLKEEVKLKERIKKAKKMLGG